VATALNKAFVMATELPQQGKARPQGLRVMPGMGAGIRGTSPAKTPRPGPGVRVVTRMNHGLKRLTRGPGA
jgi:hypothetical protein